MKNNLMSTKIFNTAIVTSKANALKSSEQKQLHSSAKLSELIKSDAFECILDSIKNLALKKSISEDEAAEEIICTFRSIDEVWANFIYEEGLTQLKRQLAPTERPVIHP